jgi:hypothetical protein
MTDRSATRSHRETFPASTHRTSAGTGAELVHGVVE